MKINIKSKVINCEDIGQNVKRFLWLRAKEKPPSFMPFQVQRVCLEPKKVCLAQYKQSFMTLLSEHKIPVPRYTKTNRPQTVKTATAFHPRTSQSVRRSQPYSNKPSEQIMIHTFYAKEIMNDQRAKTADTGFRKHHFKLSNLSSDQNFEKDYKAEVLQTDVKEYRKKLGKQAEFMKTFNQFARQSETGMARLNRTSWSNRIGHRPARKKSIAECRHSLGFSHNSKTNKFQFSYKNQSQSDVTDQ